MEKLKTELEPFASTLNQALDLVHSIDRFTSHQYSDVAKKPCNERIKLDQEIETLRKEVEELKANVQSEEQEFKLKVAKTNIISSRVKEARRTIKQLRKDEAELRRKYVESFSLVKQEPVDEAVDIDYSEAGDTSESGVCNPSPPRKKRKRIISIEEDGDEEDLENHLVQDEDLDDELVEFSVINRNEVRHRMAEQVLIGYRDPTTNPWLIWLDDDDTEVELQNVIVNDGRNSAATKGYRIPKHSVKRELEEGEASGPTHRKYQRKSGVTGGRRSLGGDAGFMCKYCNFRSQYKANVQRHSRTAHPEQPASCDGSLSPSQTSMSNASFSIASCDDSDNGSIIIPVQKKKSKRRKKWLIHYQTEDGRTFTKCSKNHVFECKECHFSSAYNTNMYAHVRRNHVHLLTSEEAESRNRNIDWSKFLNKLKVKQIKVPNDEPSDDEVIVKEELDWDTIENDESIVNGLHPGSGDTGNVNTAFQLIKPKRHYKRQQRVNVEDTYSAYKSECIQIIQGLLPLTHQEIVDSSFDVSPFEKISFESEVVKEGFSFNSVTELCIQLRKHGRKKFRTFSFKPTSIIEVENNITCDELSEKFELLLKCRNVKVLAISGLGSIHEELVETALYSLGLNCPDIEHFIVDDNVSIVKSYVGSLENNLITTIEVNNKPGDEQDMMDVVTNCPNLTAICMEDVSLRLLQAIAPRVYKLNMVWISKDLLEKFITMSATSRITHLKIDCTHVSLKRRHIKKLGRSLPQLESISVSWDLDQIHCLKYFDSGALNTVVWDTIPFDVEKDLISGNLTKEKDLSYWMEEDCKHDFIPNISKRVLHANATLPDGASNYSIQIQSMDQVQEPPSKNMADIASLLPSLEECKQKRPNVDDDDQKTEIDSEATDVEEVNENLDNMKFEDRSNNSPTDLDKSSSTNMDFNLVNSPSELESTDSDDDLFRQEITEDPTDDYSEYRKSKAKLSVRLMAQKIGDSLASLKLTIKDKLPNDVFECLAGNCPNLQSLSITSMCEPLTFTPVSFFIPHLVCLETSNIIFRDAELIDILDNCGSLQRLVMEEAANISTNAIRIVQAYSKTRALYSEPLPPESVDPPFQDPRVDPSKIQVQISTRGNENFDVLNVYDNLVFKFVVLKRNKILRKY